MKGDFTRSTFKKEKHYRGVHMQQGRVQMDADWNEQIDITAHRVEKETIDVVGECGAPMDRGGFHLVGPQSNMVGVVEMGAAPSLLPGYRSADGKGLSAVQMFQAASEGRLKALFVLGENPLITLPKSLVQEGLKGLELLVVQDMFLSDIGDEAHVFLPVLSFAGVEAVWDEEIRPKLNGWAAHRTGSPPPEDSAWRSNYDVPDLS